MGIYIKGMEMPKEGEYHMTLYVCSDGSAYMDVASFPVDEDRFEAVPVPLHDRLIDADAFLELCKDYAITPGDYEFCKRLEYALTKATTIIPASED